MGTPDAGVFWRVIAEHGSRACSRRQRRFAPSRRKTRKGDSSVTTTCRSLRTLFLAGERTDPDTLSWAEEKLAVPVLDHWWQTETGWQICGNCIGIERLPVKPGSATRPSPGMNVQVLGEDGHPVGAGTIGALVVKLPLPPGTFPTLWNAEERFRRSLHG